jgi:hypothetical protein
MLSPVCHKWIFRLNYRMRGVCLEVSSNNVFDVSSGGSIPNELLAIGIGVLFSIPGTVFRLKIEPNHHKELNRYTLPRSLTLYTRLPIPVLDFQCIKESRS